MRFFSPILKVMMSKSPFWGAEETVAMAGPKVDGGRSLAVLRAACPDLVYGDEGDFRREDETFRDVGGRCSERANFSQVSPTSAAWWRNVGTCAGVEYASRTPFGVIMLPLVNIKNKDINSAIVLRNMIKAVERKT
jgi:hypothetical protein